jgi:hypothetical protein
MHGCKETIQCHSFIIIDRSAPVSVNHPLRIIANHPLDVILGSAKNPAHSSGQHLETGKGFVPKNA